MAYSTDTFLNDYRSLEDWAQSVYDINNMENLEQEDFPKYIIKDLRYFRSVRNILTHNPNDAHAPLILLTDEFETRFHSLVHKLTDKKTVMDIAVRMADVYKRELADLVVPAIQHMHEKDYTHVPIMMNNRVWGVFSENTLFELAYENKLASVDESLKFFNLNCCQMMSNTPNVYDFISQDKTVDDVTRMFKDAADSGKRLDILFITDTGKSDGRLLGVVTAWDVAGI